MGTTTISLRDEAYGQLAAAKRDGESFSDVVLRLAESTDTAEKIAELAGGLGTEVAKAVTESSAEVRESLATNSGEE